MVWRNADIQTAARVFNLVSDLHLKIVNLYRVSTPLVLSMGVCTHTQKFMHDQTKFFLKNMLHLESLVTRLSRNNMLLRKSFP